MSENRNREGGRENHERAAEMQDGPAHAHLVASVAHAKQEHLTANEHSRQELENPRRAHEQSREAAGGFGHSEIASAAHALWEDRGCPAGSAEQDWFDAVRGLREEHLGLVVQSPAGVRE